MASKWKVIRNTIGTEDVYQVARIKRPDEPMHSGNIEYGLSQWVYSYDEAWCECERLNQEESK